MCLFGMTTRAGRAVWPLLAAAGLALSVPVVGRAATPAAQPSAIGNASVFWLQVSPAYQRTGLVAAVASGGGCGGSTCVWISRDGGAGWQRAAGANWKGTRVAIGVDGSGKENLYTQGSDTLQRSTDDGATWVDVGPSGYPTVTPGYAKDGNVAVAGGNGSDYMLHGASKDPVVGSGGKLGDLAFFYTSAYPSGGSFSPALLAAADRDKGLPVIQRCTADLRCTGNTTLAGTMGFSAPGMTLHPAGDYGSSGVVFAQTGRGIYKSSDGSNSFTPVLIGDGGATATATPMMALAPGFAANGSVRTAYVAILQIFQDTAHPENGGHSSGGIYRTTDGGTTWSRPDSTSPLTGGATSVAVAPDGRLFAGYTSSVSAQSGLLCSTDQGRTWQPSCPAVGPGKKSGSGAQTGGGHNASASCSAQSCSTTPAASGSSAGDLGAVPGVAGGSGTGAQRSTGGAGGLKATAANRAPLVAGVVAVVLALGAAAGVILRRRRPGIDTATAKPQPTGDPATSEPARD